MADSKLLKDLKAKLLRTEEERIDRDLREFVTIAGRLNIPVENLLGNPTTKSGGAGVTARSGATVKEITTAAQAWLRSHGKRARTAEIVAALVQQGLNLGVRPNKRVSSYLSRAKDIFDNKPDLGYGLVEWKGADRAPPKVRVI